MNILDLTQEKIDLFLNMALDAHTNYGVIPENDYIKNIYFVGSTLFFDLKRKNGNTECLTMSYSSECVGLFSGGNRKLLSLKALKKIKELSELVGVFQIYKAHLIHL